MHHEHVASCLRKQNSLCKVITTIFPRIYARTYYAHPRARVMSFSIFAWCLLTTRKELWQLRHARKGWRESYCWRSRKKMPLLTYGRTFTRECTRT
jgi:hypothetical protein